MGGRGDSAVVAQVFSLGFVDRAEGSVGNPLDEVQLVPRHFRNGQQIRSLSESC